MIRISTASLALASAISLAACGAGGSEFATKSTAACVKEQGQAAAAKCACEVGIAEATLTDKEKKLILTTLDMPEDAGPEAGMKALSDAGLTMADMMSLAGRMMEVQTKADAQCKA